MSGPLRVAVVTIGCKANVADSTMLAEALAAAGLELVPADGAAADVFVLNTCTVTHRADADARATVRRLRREHPTARIVATGCLAEVTPASLAALPEVDAVLGNRGKADLAQLLAAVAPDERRHGAANGGGASSEPSASSVVGPAPPVSFRPVAAIRALPTGRSRPFVKVQDGCDNACTYCIIPAARGRSRSLPPGEVLATLRRYAELGAVEVVLTGIHVGMYGRDLGGLLDGGRSDLAGLLARVDEERAGWPGPGMRVRLSSLEPDEVEERLLAALRRPTFCPHLHLPLQSGDDEVLRRMGRRYTTADYAAVVASVRAALPDAAIGADVIVGFPGESDAAFERTRAFVAGLELAYLHVFAFSPRRGTPAAGYPDAAPPLVARARSAALREVGAQQRRAFHERLVGTRTTVLVQQERGPGRFRGLTEHYVTVDLRAPGARPGELAAATIVAAERGGVRAEGS